MVLKIVLGLQLEQIATVVLDVESPHLLILPVVVLNVLFFDCILQMSIQHLQHFLRLVNNPRVLLVVTPVRRSPQLPLLLLLLNQLLNNIIIILRLLIHLVALVNEFLLHVLYFLRHVDGKRLLEVLLAEPWVV